MLDMSDTTTKLIDVGAVLRARMPSLKHYPAVLVRFFIWCLRTLVNEDRINQFLQKHGYLKGSDFIDQVFDELQLDYLVRHDEIKNIPRYRAGADCCQSSAWRAGWVGIASPYWENTP